MKKLFLTVLSCLMAVSVSAAGLVKPAASMRSIAKPAAAASLQTNNVLMALFDERSSKVPNFYLIFASSDQAKYDSNTGSITAPAGSFVLTLDLYNNVGDGEVSLAEGTYTWFDSDEAERAFGYGSDYTMLNYYDEAGNQYSSLIEDPVEVKRDASTGRYSISTLAKLDDGTLVAVSFDGPLSFGSSTERPTVYPQITRDLNLNLDKGGISYYQGVTDYSNQGVSYFDVYDVNYDEGGRMLEEGFNLCMMLAHKRFTKRELYAVCPGTYTNSNALSRDTWYPAREIDYMGFVMPFGSYLREMKVVDGERTYTYAYLKTGEFTIVDNGDGTYKGTLNAVTTLGYNVTATWSGKIALNTDNAQFTATVSDLTDDVVFDFSPLEKGRIYHTGIQGGCRTLIVDLGSPTGKDEAIQNGGDLLRMEFLVNPTNHLLEPGLYTVVPRRWNSNELAAGGTYDPGSLNKGHFDGNGAQVGTRYAHFRTGSYCVYDMVGPAEEGTVRVETDDYKNYTFYIDLMDDAGFKMQGEWINKPIEYNYDAEALKELIASGVSVIGDDNNPVKAVIEGDNLFVINAGNAPVAVYAVDGRKVYSTTADRMIPVSALGKGVFIISTNNTTLKISL